MKRILNFIKNHTFYSTLIYITIFILLECLLSIFNVMFRSWIYQISLIILIGGILLSIIKNINKVSKKIIKIILFVLLFGFCIFLGLFIFLFIAFQHRPTYVVKKDNQKYVAYVHNPWDITHVYYYKYINPFIVSREISIDEFYDTPANPFENEEIMKYKEVAG